MRISNLGESCFAIKMRKGQSVKYKEGFKINDMEHIQNNTFNLIKL